MLTLGTADIPIPPANVDPADYAAWFQEKIGSEENKADLPGALSLHSSVQREYMEARYSRFAVTPSPTALVTVVFSDLWHFVHFI